VKTSAGLIGLIVIVVGVIGILAPDALVTIGRYVITPVGLYIVAIVRIGVGLVFIGASGASRFPRTLRVFGAIVVVAGLATPLFGVERSVAVLNWESAQGPAFIRLVAGFVLALGSFVVYLVLGGRRAA
jgi:hypothetical protein